MSHFKDFTSSDEFQPPVRDIDSDAPEPMRHELIDLIFHIAEHNSSLNEEKIQRIICQSIGEGASGKPYAGYRHVAGRDLRKADWRKVYDLVCRLWPEFKQVGEEEYYRQNVNRIFSSNRVVWEMNKIGRIQRYLPQQAQTLVSAAIIELNTPRFVPAFSLFNAAKEAFDDRPRRDRDVCTNIFDTMESVAKEIFNIPNATFGSVLKHVRQTRTLKTEIISILEAINTLRNRKFGHGMTVQFDLSSSEVDFTYLTCIGAILLLVGLHLKNL